MIIPSAVFFDLDGTFVDTAPDFIECINLLRSQSGHLKLTPEYIRRHISDGANTLTQLAFPETNTLDTSLFDERKHIFLNTYQEKIGTHSALYNGIDELIHYLETQNITWGIVTNKPKKYTQILLNRLSIHSAITVCPDDVTTPKPAPDSLILAAKNANVSPSTCWYIGDHQRDIQAAISARMLSIAAGYGYLHTDDDITKWHADVIINSPADIINLLTPPSQ
jgi:2-phosphoglycolate phosphatase